MPYGSRQANRTAPGPRENGLATQPLSGRIRRKRKSLRLFGCAAEYFAFTGRASAVFSSAVARVCSRVPNTSGGLPPCAGASAKYSDPSGGLREPAEQPEPPNGLGFVDQS